MTATSETAWAGRHVCLGSKNGKAEDPLAGFVFSESHAATCSGVVFSGDWGRQCCSRFPRDSYEVSRLTRAL